MIDLDTFHDRLAQSDARGYQLDSKQKEALDYEVNPLWLIAGPGSAKSEVLVTRNNITVVGDDDQALYRFRGGTVTCMVNFDQACKSVFNQSPHQID